jgi:hypothetical protein
VNPSSPAAVTNRRPFPPERRNLAVAYLLWALALVGVCGVHRFYNRKPLSGALWLFTFGLCGIGQVVDLFLMQDMVQQANQPLLLEEALAAAETQALPPIERQLLALARRSGMKGWSCSVPTAQTVVPSAPRSSGCCRPISSMSATTSGGG